MGQDEMSARAVKSREGQRPAIALTRRGDSMGIITSASMPMLVVENITDGNRAYCNLNEGSAK